jgi:cyclin A
MLVSSKYEEIYAPQVEEMCYITDNTYTREAMLEMEREVLGRLAFDLTQPTTKTFLRRFIKAASGEWQASCRWAGRPA